MITISRTGERNFSQGSAIALAVILIIAPLMILIAQMKSGDVKIREEAGIVRADEDDKLSLGPIEMRRNTGRSQHGVGGQPGQCLVPVGSIRLLLEDIHFRLRRVRKLQLNGIQFRGLAQVDDDDMSASMLRERELRIRLAR